FAETSTGAGTTAIDISRVSIEEFQLIEAFLQRRESLESEVRRDMATQIARRIGAKLGVEVPPWPACEKLLEGIFEQVRAKGLRG
ncbi:MAG: hypothetical protein KGL59_13620, partial [Acidobacteriota bacterium]|nr:hypothetical protein [Acidobacteriota bacterium]